MKCPACTTSDLLMSERSGIEIDYCPQCRGVWLDRGELDKILERSAQEMSSPNMAAARQSTRFDPNRFGADHHQSRGHDHEQHYGHGKKPFWKELFD